MPRHVVPGVFAPNLSDLEDLEDLDLEARQLSRDERRAAKGREKGAAAKAADIGRSVSRRAIGIVTGQKSQSGLAPGAAKESRPPPKKTTFTHTEAVQLPAAKPSGTIQPVRASPAAAGVKEPAESGIVNTLRMEIQRGFRIKLMCLLLLHIALLMGIAAFVLFAMPAMGADLNEGLGGSRSVPAGIICGTAIMVWPFLYLMRDLYPRNFISTIVWTVHMGIACGIAHGDDGFMNDFIGFHVYLAIFVGVSITTVLATYVFKEKDGNKYLMPFRKAGKYGYLVMTVCYGVYVGLTEAAAFDSLANMIAIYFLASFLFFWVVFDAGDLSGRLEVDMYLGGVLYFYTDFMWLMCCGVFMYWCSCNGVNAADVAAAQNRADESSVRKQQDRVVKSRDKAVKKAAAALNASAV